MSDVAAEYKVDPTDLRLSGLEAFTLDYVVKWPVSLVISRKVSLLFSSFYIFSSVFPVKLSIDWVHFLLCICYTFPVLSQYCCVSLLFIVFIYNV